MVLGIPTNFQAVSNVLANYNFVDIASGTGFINFYAGKTVDLNLLSNYTYYSNAVATSAALPVSPYTKIIDLDFDVVLNRPLDLKGLCTLNVPLGISSLTAQNHYGYVIAKVRKWDGVTETDICENTSSVITYRDGDHYSMLAIDLDIPLTHFKIGETLRLTIEGWGYAASAAGNLVLGHDPKSRTTGWDSTGAVPSQLVFQVPVRLNL